MKFCVRIFFPALLIILTGCGSINRDEQPKAEPKPGSLEAAAIETGAIPELGRLSLAGSYELRSEIGTDRFCAVSIDEKVYRIGIVATFGPNAYCEGQGRAALSGEKVLIRLSGKGKCSLTASFDGAEIRFPGRLSEDCKSYCTPRASLAGVSLPLMEEGNDPAMRVAGRNMEKLCG